MVAIYSPLITLQTLSIKTGFLVCPPYINLDVQWDNPITRHNIFDRILDLNGPLSINLIISEASFIESSIRKFQCSSSLLPTLLPYALVPLLIRVLTRSVK